MTNALSLSKKLDSEPRVVRRLFSLQDWTWPSLAWGCAIAMVVFTSSLEASSDSWTLKGNPYAFIGLIFICVVAFIRFKVTRRAKRLLSDSIRGRSQFVVINDDGIRFGWEGVIDVYWSWTVIGSVTHRSDDALILRSGTERMKLKLWEFETDEKDALLDYLIGRQLLVKKNGSTDRRTTTGGTDKRS